MADRLGKLRPYAGNHSVHLALLILLDQREHERMNTKATLNHDFGTAQRPGDAGTS